MSEIYKYNICKECLFDTDGNCINSEYCNPENEYKHYVRHAIYVCKQCIFSSTHSKGCPYKGENKCTSLSNYRYFIHETAGTDINGKIVNYNSYNYRCNNHIDSNTVNTVNSDNTNNPQPLGLRFNEGKRKWSLVDFDSLEDMVKVLEFGAKKYGEYNWQKGLKTTDIIESMLRHVFSYLNGEDNDKESGISHIGHIQCNAMFLAYMQKNKPELDSRRLKAINQSNKSIQEKEIDKEQRKELNKE